MKKLLAFLLLVVYLCVSTGFTVSTHYCMNKQRSVELGAVQKNFCEKCGMLKRESHGCCRDEVRMVKLQQDTQVAKLLLPSFELALPIVFTTTHLLTPFYNFAEQHVAIAFSPPLLHDENLCVDYCVFRI